MYKNIVRRVLPHGEMSEGQGVNNWKTKIIWLWQIQGKFKSVVIQSFEYTQLSERVSDSEIKDGMFIVELSRTEPFFGF